MLRRFPPGGLLSWALAQAAAGAVLLMGSVAQPRLWAVLIALFVLVSAVGFALPNASALAMDRHRPIAGSASAVLGLSQYALATVTTPLVGLGDRASTCAGHHRAGSVATGALAAAWRPARPPGANAARPATAGDDGPPDRSGQSLRAPPRRQRAGQQADADHRDTSPATTHLVPG